MTLGLCNKTRPFNRFRYRYDPSVKNDCVCELAHTANDWNKHVIKKKLTHLKDYENFTYSYLFTRSEHCIRLTSNYVYHVFKHMI
jgi:hypothetical protein